MSISVLSCSRFNLILQICPGFLGSVLRFFSLFSLYISLTIKKKNLLISSLSPIALFSEWRFLVVYTYYLLHLLMFARRGFWDYHFRVVILWHWAWEFWRAALKRVPCKGHLHAVLHGIPAAASAKDALSLFCEVEGSWTIQVTPKQTPAPLQ